MGLKTFNESSFPGPFGHGTSDAGRSAMPSPLPPGVDRSTPAQGAISDWRCTGGTGAWGLLPTRKSEETRGTRLLTALYRGNRAAEEQVPGSEKWLAGIVG